MFAALLRNEWQAQARLRRGALVVLVGWYFLALGLSHYVWGADAPLTTSLMVGQPLLWLPFYGLAVGLQAMAEKKANGSFSLWLALPVSPALALGAKLTAFLLQVLLATMLGALGITLLNWLTGATLLSFDPARLLLSLLTYWLTCLLLYQGALTAALADQALRTRQALLPVLLGTLVSTTLFQTFKPGSGLAPVLCVEAAAKPICYGLNPATPLLAIVTTLLLAGWFAAGAWLVGQRLEV